MNLEKYYINYVDEVFLYMLTVDDNPELLETIKKSNPKLKKIAMSAAEILRQEGRQEGILIGQQKGKLEGKIEGEREKALAIAKAMLIKHYPVQDIILFTGLSQSDIQNLL